MRLHYHTLKYLTVTFLIAIAIWACLFYVYILEEVYDTIDDGLKNSKTKIIREVYKNPEILNTQDFGINHFRFIPLPPGNYPPNNQIYNTSEYLEYNDENEPIRILTTIFYDVNRKPYKLEIKTSMIEKDHLLTDLGGALLVLYFMLLISILILNYFLLKKTWKSFYLLLAKLKNYTLGCKEKFMSPDTTVKEFKDLELEIEKMIQRNESTFTQQKLFISNASHEIQTPLAVSLNKLELLAEDPQITKKQMKEISSINNCLTRLTKLNKSLLMLSKIENNQFTEKENILFNNLIKNIHEDFSDLIEYKNIHITIIEHGNFSFEMDKGLAIILLNNLFKNAIIYNYNSGNITFIITDSYFIIQNTSTYPALDPEQIFNRFYKKTNNSQSLGLGLTLVKTIVNCYPNLSIEYFFDEYQNFKISKFY